jgi:ABC-type sugar transport system permease subunit
MSAVTIYRADRRGQFWERLAPYAFIAPFFIGFFVFQLFPIAFSTYLSVAKWNPYVRDGSGLSYIGVENFRNLFDDSRFIHSLRVTAIITINCTIIGTALAVVLAVLLDKVPERLSMILRGVFFMPAVTSAVVIAQIWRQLLNTRYGYFNAVLEHIGIEPQNWLKDPAVALWAVIIMLVWSGLGWDSLIIMSGLRNIPHELYEAARIDGASAWREFWSITLPLLRPVLVFVVTTGLIYLLGIFAPVQLLTNGGPLHKTEPTALYLYYQAFQLQEFGYASAIAVTLTLIMFTVSFLNYRFFGRDLEY